MLIFLSQGVARFLSRKRCVRRSFEIEMLTFANCLDLYGVAQLTAQTTAYFWEYLGCILLSSARMAGTNTKRKT